MATAYVSASSPFKRLSGSGRRRSSAAGFGLDAFAEYIDADGVPRRSENVTRRMIQRGVSISKAIVFSDDEQAHTSCAQREQEAERARQEATALLQSSQRKRDRNSAMKAQTKRDKMQKVEEANALVAERLALWYDQRYLSPREEAAADVTERNTEHSPSKTNAFIDSEGNLRRRQTQQVVEAVETAATMVAPIGTPPAQHEPGSSNVVGMASGDDKVAVVRPEQVTLTEKRV